MAAKKVSTTGLSSRSQLWVAAEAKLALLTASELSARSDTELLHELQLHQIELETQNEALIEAQIALEESRARFVDFYEFAPVGYLTVTDKGLIADINQTGAALLGRERDDLLLQPFARFVEPEDADGWHLHLVGSLKTDERRSCELELLRVDGAHVDVRLDSLRLVKDEQTPALRVVLTDITKWKQAEARLLSTKIQLRATLDAIPDLIFEVGLDGRYYDYHSPRSDLLAAPPEVFLGKTFSEVLPPDVAETCISAIVEASDKGWSSGRQYALSLPQGERWFELSVAPKQGTKSQAKRFIFVARDITERKQAEKVLRESEARYERAVTGANDGIWEWVLATGENYMSPRWKQMLGYEDHELPNTLASFAAHLHPDDKARVMEMRRAHFEEREPYGVEMRLCCKSGEYRWFYSRGQATWDENGQPVIMSGSITDVTGRKQVEDALRESEFRWQFAIEGSGDGVWDWNILTDHATYSKRWKEMLGYAEDDIQSINQDWVTRIHPEDQAYVAGAMQAYLEGKTEIYVVEYRLRCKDESYKWILGRGMAVSRSEDGKPLRMIGTHTDITERKQMEEQVRHLAFYDTLTKLPNRRLLNDRLSQGIAASKRSGCYGALMFLDLDNFKSLNDTHGHEAGDLLLIEAADRLKGCVREMDTVARFGGDEFVVMVSELGANREESATQAGIIAEMIRSTLLVPYRLTLKPEGKTDISIEHRCTASIGVALFAGHDSKSGHILRWADTAMYEAKEAGRNLIRFYDAKA
jgi:diguanylate cyclase (GGDEF)-like protein/PAS domain S-box-containing protein